MGQGQTLGMKQEPRGHRQGSGMSIKIVSQDRMADRGQVQPDLTPVPRRGPNFQPSPIAQPLDDAPTGYCRPAARSVDAVSRRMIEVFGIARSIVPSSVGGAPKTNAK